MSPFIGFRDISYSPRSSISSSDSNISFTNMSSPQGSNLSPSTSNDPDSPRHTNRQRRRSSISALLKAASEKLQHLTTHLHKDLTPPPSSGMYTPFIIGNNARRSSISELLVAASNKLQKVAQSLIQPDKSIITEVVIFSDNFALDLPVTISRDTSEIEYLRRINTEEATAAYSLKAALAHPGEEIITAVTAIEEAEIIISDSQATVLDTDIESSTPTDISNNVSETEEISETLEAKLARNPFWPCQDLRLTNWKSAVQEEEEAIQRRQDQEFERFALSLTFDQLQAMTCRPDFYRIFSIRTKAHQEANNSRLSAINRQIFESRLLESTASKSLQSIHTAIAP